MKGKKYRFGSRKNQFAAGLAAAVALGLAGNAMAGTITYNFNTDGSFADTNGQNPLTVTTDTGNSATVASGELTLSADGSNGASYNGATLTTPFSVSGDFTASVDVNFVNPGNDLLVFRATGANDVEMYGASTFSQAHSDSFGSANGPALTSGTFNLVRSGDSITASWTEGGVTDTFTDSSLVSSTPFILNIQLPGFTSGPTAATATFDNFTITSDSIPVPEPASLGLLAVGGLTLLRRRRRGSK